MLAAFQPPCRGRGAPLAAEAKPFLFRLRACSGLCRRRPGLRLAGPRGPVLAGRGAGAPRGPAEHPACPRRQNGATWCCRAEQSSGRGETPRFAPARGVAQGPATACAAPRPTRGAASTGRCVHPSPDFFVCTLLGWELILCLFFFCSMSYMAAFCLGDLMCGSEPREPGRDVR